MAVIFLAVSARSEIPFTHALGVYEATKDEYKHLSPFWGMVALDMLRNLRFYGNYETFSSGENVKDKGKDAIANLILWLFPSPDGIQLVANGNRQDPVGDLSRSPLKINNIIETLLSNEGKQKEKIMAALKLDPNTKTKIKNEFADVLLSAYEQQNELANPEKPEKQLYPKDIVIISLLAFFVKVTDDKIRFKDLSFLMKEDFDAMKKFDIEDYWENKNNIDGILKNQDASNLEKAYFMAKGYEHYENSFAKPVAYQNGVCFRNQAGFSDCGETSLRNVLMLLLPRMNNKITTQLEYIAKNIEPAAGIDIMKTPFRKVFDYFIKFPNLEEASLKKAHDAWAEVVSDLNLEEKDKPSLEDVQYGRPEKGKTKRVYELKALFSNIGVNGIINMLNVIAKILPDQKLNKPWPKLEISDDLDETEGFKLAAEKLTRFCEILSAPDHVVSWYNADSKDQTIRNHFPGITLQINKEDAYGWGFFNNHFVLTPKASSENAWPVGYQNASEKIFFNEWIASLYLHLSPDNFIENSALGSIYPRAFIFGSHANLGNLDEMIRTISFILYRNKAFELSQFIPLLARFIEKSIYIDDEHPLRLIANLLLAASKVDQLNESAIALIKWFPKINEKINEMAKDTDVNALAQDMQQHKEMASALIFLNADPNFNKLTPSRVLNDVVLRNLPNLTDLNLASNEKITDEGIKNLNRLNKLNLSNNNKISDEGIKNLLDLSHLNLADNDQITDDGIKNLTQLTSLNLADNQDITDEGIENLTKLSDLNLDDNDEITDKGLKNLTQIISLSLANNDEISDKSIRKFIGMTNLNLASNDQISNDIVKSFEQLESLNLTNNEEISDEGIIGLKKLTTLNLERNRKITDKSIKSLKQLQSLDLANNIFITDGGLENLNQLLKLNLSYNRAITNSGLQNLNQLKSLNLTFNEKIDDRGLEKLRKLEDLNLASNNKITNAGIMGLTELFNLNLDRNRKITDEGIKNLIQLRTINLAGNRMISNDGLKNLPLLIYVIR